MSSVFFCIQQFVDGPINVIKLESLESDSVQLLISYSDYA